MAEDKFASLTDLQQFRLDVIEALSAIDTEIDALQQAIEEGKVLTPTRLKKLRAETRDKLWKFRNFHSEKIALI